MCRSWSCDDDRHRSAPAPARGRRDRAVRPGGPASPYTTPHTPSQTRVCFAAAHVVADPLAPGDPDGPAQLDWEATLAFRRHLWSHGFQVAEAMDTAQRGMGLDWPASQELIRRSVAEAKSAGRGIAAGAGTDQLPAGARLKQVRRAYEEQCAFVEAEGAQVILMASRALAAAATGPDDYAATYGHLLAELSEPAILHWLGPMFDPALEGYWDPTHPATSTPPPTRCSRSSRRTATRSTGSRSRCSTTSARWRCDAGCPTASACTPATTSTTPS